MNGDGGGAARRRALLRRVVLRGAEACAAVMDAVVRWTGPVLSVVVVLLIGTLTQVYLMELLPAAREEMGDARAAAWTAAGLYLVAGISYHYYRVSVRGPGHPPRELPRAVLRALADDPQLNPAALATDPTTRRFCKHCRAVKPMRTHHCSVCRRCVLKMDHHCPWMNNCVGHDNLRHFYLFLVYAMLGCALFLRVGWTRVRPALRAKSEEPVHFLLCVVAAAAVFLAAGLFVAWNTFLLARNQTTIEFYGSSCGGDRRPRNTVHANPYYLGVAANLRQVFGSGLVVLWPWAAPPPGDGLTFPVLPGRPFSYHATTLEEILVDPEPAEGRRRAT